MTDLATRYLGLQLANPVIVSSCGLTQTVEGVRHCAEAGAGAVVLKSIFEEQIQLETAELSRSAESTAWHPEAQDYIDAYGREHAVAGYLELIREAKRAVSIPVIASVHCVTAGGWTDFTDKIALAGADAIELNVFVLPSDARRDAKDNERVYFDVARKVTSRVSIPVALKIGPYFSALSRTALDLSRTGIAGLVLFNRFFPIDFDIEEMQLVPGAIHSAPEETVLPLRWISILSGRVACDLGATTGVHDGAAVVKHLLAGAAAVHVCSTLYEHGVAHLGTVVEQLRRWMERRGHRSIDAFRGALAQRKGDNPAAYERVQFMRATAGIE